MELQAWQDSRFYPIRRPSWPTISVPVALSTPNFLLIATNRPLFNMTPRKSYRVRKPRTI
jgi:hypothetical protein